MPENGPLCERNRACSERLINGISLLSLKFRPVFLVYLCPRVCLCAVTVWTCQWWWRRFVDARESKATSRDALRPLPPEEELSCTLHAPAAPPRVFRVPSLGFGHSLEVPRGRSNSSTHHCTLMAEQPATARTGIPFPTNKADG